MKTTLILSLIALGAAADAPAESDNSYGYEAPSQEADTVPEVSSEEPEEFTGPQSLCVACPVETPCWTGVTCVARVAESAAYGEEESSEKAARFLSDVQKVVTPELVCPCGAVDTQFYELTSNIILWVAFGLLFLPALYFFFVGYKLSVEHHVARPAIGSGIINMVASLAYLTMALGYGAVKKCNGRTFYFARYIDWLITTPIMMFHYVEIATSDNITKYFIVLLDIFMIAAGLIGELIEGPERWAFFGFGMFAFIPILYVLCGLAGGFCSHKNNTTTKLFKRIVVPIMFVWFVYPVIYILAQVYVGSTECGYNTAQTGYNTVAGAVVSRVGVISVQSEAYAYTVLDIIAKSIVGIVIVCNEHEPRHQPTNPNPTSNTWRGS